MAVDCVRYFARKTRLNMAHVLVVFIIIISSVQLLSMQKRGFNLLRKGPQSWFKILTRRYQFDAKGRHNENVRKTGAWIKENISLKDNLLCSGSVVMPIHFLTEMNYDISSLSVFS